MDINKEKLLSLLKDFHMLTGIKICVFDEHCREIAFYPERLCPFCEYIRTSESGAKECTESDRKGFEFCKKTGQKYVYNCHMGLSECIAPILHDGSVIGYLMLGQTASDINYTEEIFNKKIKGYCLDAQRAQKLYKSINFSSKDKIQAAVNIMEACAGFLYLKRLVKASQKSFLVKINNYIENNIQGRITTEDLCREFSVSRSELYRIFNIFFNTSVAQHIKNSRLKKACKLITENIPIGIVAEKCGIPDYNYFSKVFKKNFGVSPTKFRKDAVK